MFEPLLSFISQTALHSPQN